MKNLEDKSFRFNKFLYFSVWTVNLITLTLGISFAWSSPAIPRLNGSIEPENNPLLKPITSQEESLIASLMPLGAIFGAFLSGFISDKIGRKNALLLSGIPNIVGFSLCAFPKNIFFFYFGRFLTGFGGGITLTVVPVYVGEISEPHNRGFLSCIFVLNITIGNLLVYALAPYCGIYNLSIIGLCIPIVFMVTFGRFVPESPYYFIIKNEVEKARMSLSKLRYNNEEIVETELPIIKKNIEEAFSKKRKFSDFIKDRGLSRGLMLALSLAAFQQFSGINILFFYMQSIFEDAKTSLSSDLCTVIVGIVQCSTSLLATFTIDRFGRKLLLFVSAIGMMTVLSILSVYFCLKENSVDLQHLNAFPIIFLNLYVVAYTLGFGPVVFGVAGELFPVYAKSMASTFTTCTMLTSTFIVTTIFPYLKDLIGMGLTFAALGVICFFAACFVYFKVPETKEKSLQEIEEMLRK